MGRFGGRASCVGLVCGLIAIVGGSLNLGLDLAWGQGQGAEAELPLLRLASAQAQLGESVAVELVLVRAPQGLQQYVFVVRVGDPQIAEIAGVEGVNPSGEAFQLVGQAPDRAEFRALDLEDRIKAGAEDVVLARLTLRARQAGTTDLVLEVEAFVDDRGVKLSPAVEPGRLMVQSAGAKAPGGPPRIPPATSPPQDLDGDGLYEDINGDGRLTSEDAVFLLSHLDDPLVQANAAFFDFNRDGLLDSQDAAALLALVPPAPPPPPVPEPTVLRLSGVRARLGEPAALEVVLAQAPQGLEKYELLVRVADPAVAQIVGAESAALPPAFFEVLSRSEGEVRFRAADFNDAIRPGARDVVLARLRLQGLQAGRTEVTLSVVVFTAEDSRSLSPTVEPGWAEFFKGPPPLRPGLPPPQDLDGDGLYEDLNGDGTLDTRDALLLAFNLDNPVVRENVEFFDFNGDGRVTFADAVALAAMIP